MAVEDGAAKEIDVDLMVWLRRLARSRLVDLLVAAMALLQIVRLAQMLPTRAFEWDFNTFYIASHILRDGANPYATPLGPLSEQLGFVHSATYLASADLPPSFLWLLAPLSLLPPRVAFWVWFAVQIVSLGAILLLTRQLLGERLSVRGWFFVCAGTVASEILYFHLYFSQAQLLMAAMVLGAFALHRAGRHTGACLLVTAATVVKLSPAILLPWFIWRSGSDVRTRLTRLAWAVGFAILAVLVTGPGLWRDFFQQGLPRAMSGEIGLTYHFSLTSFLTNHAYAVYDFSPPEAIGRIWSLAGIAVGGALILAAYWWTCLRKVQDCEAEFCLLCVAMLAGSPTAEGYYFVFMIFPMAVAAVRLAQNPTLARVVFFGALLVLLNRQHTWATPFLNSHIHWKIFANYLPLYALVGLGIFFVRQLRAAETNRT